jgi:hypothetical protein
MSGDLRAECARVIWETAQELMGSPGIPVWDSGQIADRLLADGLVQTAARSVKREKIVDALVMTRLSDYAGNDMRLIEQAASAVVSALEKGEAK